MAVLQVFQAHHSGVLAVIEFRLLIVVLAVVAVLNDLTILVGIIVEHLAGWLFMMIVL